MKDNNKTIIGFDSWTQGAHHFVRLASEFKLQGYNLLLIHVGSWGHDANRLREERIGLLTVRDISYYNTNSFKKILEIEKPCAVIFLSIQAFTHRAFNRYCKNLSIPTFHLYHGLVKVQDTYSKRLNSTNWNAQFFLFRKRFFKNIRRIIPIYIRSLIETSASPSEYLWLINDVFRKLYNTSYSGKAAPDCKTTACFVYTKADISHAIERYNSSEKKTIAVGNPDLIKFMLSEEHIAGRLKNDNIANKSYIVYIDTALIESASVFSSKVDFIEHIKTTKNILNEQELDLIVKLHPAHYRNDIAKNLKSCNIQICENKDFISTLRHADAVIVEPSSAAIIPALMGIPILLAKYGKLSQQNYGEILLEYPLSKEITDLFDIKDIIRETKTTGNKIKTLQWIKENSGPMPAQEMPKRLVKEIIRFSTLGNNRK